MTERHLTESAVGVAGRLSHIPFGTGKSKHCGWQSSRHFTRRSPAFQAIGPSKTWIRAEPYPLADSLPPAENLWKRKRRQSTWLVKSHPEAGLGNDALQDLLDENEALPSQDELESHSCLFSLGELTDNNLLRSEGVPLIVTVTGRAHNVLRLAKLDQEKWIWHRLPNVSVRLSDASLEKPALWIGDDVSPIHRVKCLVNHKEYSPVRWVAVQRHSGTTILQPECEKIPQDGNLETDASRISPNPLFHISKDQTGGNTHTDVAYNPAARSKPPQLAIVDDRGYWSIWEFGFTRLRNVRMPVPSLKICGHINRGLLEQVPYNDRSDTKWHKILWVGSPEDTDDFEFDIGTDDMRPQNTNPPVPHSSSLLVYNSRQVKLYDLNTNLYLPDIEFCRKDSLDHVLDVQTTHDPQYLCVLTTSKLFIVRTYSQPGAELDKPEKVWSVLFSTLHYRSIFDRSLKLAITQGVKSRQAAWLVFIYASKNAWTEAFYVRVSPSDPNKVLCQSNVAGLGEIQNTILNSSIRTLCISSAQIISKGPKYLSKTGRALARKKTRIYQIVVQKWDMSLVSGLCALSRSPSIRLGVPNRNVGRRTKVDRQRGIAISSRRRPHFIVNGSDQEISDDGQTTDASQKYQRDQRNIKTFYDHLITVYSERSKHGPSRSLPENASDPSPFDAVPRNLDQSLLADGPLPPRTLLQMMPNFREASKTAFTPEEWEEEIERLNSIHPNVAVYSFDPLRSHLGLPLSATLREAISRLLEIINASLDNRGSRNANSEQMVATADQIAYDLYLSLFGIGARNRVETQSQSQADPDAGESMVLDSQTDTAPSSPPRSESIFAPTTPSQMSTTSDAVEGEDPAMTLIRSYTGTGRFVPEKKFELLDKWQLGADPADYVFDLDRSEDVEESKERKAKQKAREERKRRRAKALFQLSQQDTEIPSSQPPALPATQPVPPIKFADSQSRPTNSQRPAFVAVTESSQRQTMSQPTPGAFGKRPINPMKKRKTGF